LIFKDQSRKGLKGAFIRVLRHAHHLATSRTFLGDFTAWRLSRVSFNPLVHIDPFGTVVLPVILPLLRAPYLESTVTVQRTLERTTLVAIQSGGKPWNGLAGKHR
jgi:Zn-dependent protease